ncbi:MAG: hypothetical protein ACI4AK_02145 [Lepagella sp.]
MKRIITILAILIALCSDTLWADSGDTIKLNSKDKRTYQQNLGFGYITFEYLYSSTNTAHVRVVVENTTQYPPYSLLIFRKDTEEKYLKQSRPKIEFSKKFPGVKNHRIARGCPEGYKTMYILTPSETDTLYSIDVSHTSPKEYRLPIYLAKYKPKDLLKKGKTNIKYEILEEYIFNVVITVEGWTEDDETYVNMKQKVEAFLSSLNSLSLCESPKHQPNFADQKKKYQDKINSLIEEITDIIESNGWMKKDRAHIAYSELINKLSSIDLDKYATVCNKHKTYRGDVNRNSCKYCKMSSQQIYHKLDKVYQALYSNNITKQNAINSVKGMYNCYQRHKGSNRDRSYDSKISSFYNRIVSY